MNDTSNFESEELFLVAIYFYQAMLITFKIPSFLKNGLELVTRSMNILDMISKREKIQLQYLLQFKK